MKNKKLMIIVTILLAMAAPIQCIRRGGGGRGGFRGGRMGGRGFRSGGMRRGGFRRGGARMGGRRYHRGGRGRYAGRRYHHRRWRRPYRRYWGPGWGVGVGLGLSYPYWGWYNRYDCDYCYDQPNTVYYVQNQNTAQKQALESRVKQLEAQLKAATSNRDNINTQTIKNLHEQIYNEKRHELERILEEKEQEYANLIEKEDKESVHQARKVREIIKRINKDMKNMRNDFNKMMRDLDRHPAESQISRQSY